MTRPPTASALSRREFVATAVAGASGLAGCTRRFRTATGREPSRQVTLELKTAPADSDPYALRITRALADWYRAAGIDAQVEPVAEEELLRDTLLNDDFDIFVTRFPASPDDPDSLYSLLHSRFSEANGWQNPFGYANLTADDHLETQRRTSGRDRREAVDDLQRTLVETQPFSLVGFPDDIRAARDGSYTGWNASSLGTPSGYLSLESTDDSDEDGRGTLTVASTDARATINLNPLAVEFRRRGVVTGLLYDALARQTDGGVEPALAMSWEFVDDDPPRMRLELDSNATWHDGEPLTASDVVFTYDFLGDTSLRAEAEDTPEVPAPRFRGRHSLLDDVRSLDDSTVELRFADCAPNVATRALTVPLLPEHVWRSRTEPASIGGIEVSRATEALVTNNVPPVGSGPFRFVDHARGDRVVLERFEEYYGYRRDDGRSETAVRPPFDRFAVQTVGSDSTAVEVVATGDADVTGTVVGARSVPRIGREDDISLVSEPSSTPYIVGYNTRRSPLTNPRFRVALARLVDRAYVVDEIFRGHGRPAVSLFIGTTWLAEDLAWDDSTPAVPFVGSEGTVDEERTRAMFRDLGYRYDGEALLEGS